jgi:hypothetical protein
VDDHQVAFTRRMAAQGHVIEIRSAEELIQRLDTVEAHARDATDLTDSLEALGAGVIAKRLASAPHAALGPATIGRRVMQALRASRHSPAGYG